MNFVVYHPFHNLKGPFKTYHPLAANEQNDLNSIHEPLQQNKKKSFVVRYLVLAFSTASLLFLLALYFIGEVQVQRKGLFRTPIPTEPIIISPKLEDESWKDLLPNGDGMIYIPNPKKFSLPPGLLSGNHERKKYGLSWTHQTHCLMMIRDEYRLLLSQKSDFVKGEENLNREDRERFHHITHCFDYLRQTVECNADMTVEWAAEEPDELGGLYHINGYGMSHQCRSREFVRGFMEEHSMPSDGHDGSHSHAHSYNV